MEWIAGLFISLFLGASIAMGIVAVLDIREMEREWYKRLCEGEWKDET